MERIVFDQFLDAVDQVDCAARRLNADQGSSPSSVFSALGRYGRAERHAIFAELHRLRYRFIPDLTQAFGRAVMWRFADAIDRFDDRLRDRFELRPVRIHSNVFALTRE